MSECMIFYGPTVPEINYSSSSSSSSPRNINQFTVCHKSSYISWAAVNKLVTKVSSAGLFG